MISYSSHASSVYLLDRATLYVVSAFICLIAVNNIPGASAVTIHHCAVAPVIGIPFVAANLVLWSFIAAVNLCVAVPICARFFVAQKKMHKFLSPSPYKSVAIIFVECGTLITVCSIVMLIFYARSYNAALVSLGIATQIAVRLSPSFSPRLFYGLIAVRIDCISATHHRTPCYAESESRDSD